MQSLTEITPREIAPGFIARLIHGNQTTLSIVDIKKGSVLVEHKHIHEQITYVLKGQLNMVIGGEQFVLTAGCVHVIAPNVPHSATAITDVTVVDAFSPVREDYK